MVPRSTRGHRPKISKRFGAKKKRLASKRGNVTGLLKLSRAIDALNIWIGRIVAWAILAAVVVSTVNAIIRKLFDMSSNSWLELQWYLYAAVFLLCAAWTLIDNEHIRIDIVNNMLPKRLRDSIDLFGHVFFLLPFAVVLVITGWPFFMASFRINEQSPNAGGLTVWPAKLLVPVCFTLLLLQAISEIIKRIAIMRDLIPDPHAARQHAAEIEAQEILKAIEEAKKEEAKKKAGAAS
jgi:TRAP-type mannitol/chloroaromatic compound transport system permease small subunit